MNKPHPDKARPLSNKKEPTTDTHEMDQNNDAEQIQTKRLETAWLHLCTSPENKTNL